MKCLIVIDYQRDFVTGSLGFPGALELEQPIADKICRYHAAGDAVVFTLDIHDTQYPNTRQGKAIPTPHCYASTPGCTLYGKPAAQRLPQDMVFEKHTYGCPELFRWLRQQNFEALEIVGLVTHMCVLVNAVLAQTALPEVPIFLDAACVAAPDSQLHRAALTVLEGLHMHVTGWDGQ